MKIHLKELQEGSNALAFDLSQDELNQFVSEADDLYFARHGGAKVEMTIDRVNDLLSVRGRVDGDAGFECARCLRENARPVAIRLRWTMVPRKQLMGGGATSDEEVALTTDDLEVSFYEGEELDLTDLVREAILLDLDPAPRCEVDGCEFAEYTTASPVPEGEPVDPRWAPLAALKDKLRK
jgi:uncharacterized protein